MEPKTYLKNKSVVSDDYSEEVIMIIIVTCIGHTVLIALLKNFFDKYFLQQEEDSYTSKTKELKCLHSAFVGSII